MIAAVFEMKSDFVHRVDLIRAGDIQALFDKYERVQDFECLIRQGRFYESGEEALEQLESMEDFFCSLAAGSISADDLRGFGYDLSVGSFHVLDVAESEESYEALKQRYLNAKIWK